MKMAEMVHKDNPSIAEQEAIDLLMHISDHAEDLIFIVDEDRSIRFLDGGSLTSERVSRLRKTLDGLSEFYRVLMESAERVFKLGKPLSTVHYLEKEGRKIWLHVRLTPITGTSVNVSPLLGMARDISELKGRDKLAWDSGAEWLRAIDAMPHLMAVIDTNFRIKKANRALADYFGIAAQDLQGRTCQELLGFCDPVENCFLRPEGPLNQGPADFQSNLQGRPFLFTVSPLIDESGNATSCLLVGRNVGGNPETAEVKRKNAKAMRLLMSRAEYLITIQDRHGKYISVRALPGNVRLPEAIIGKTPFDFFETEVANSIRERINKVIDTGRDFTVSTELKLEGETFCLLEHISPVIDETGKAHLIMTVSQKVVKIAEEPMAMPNEVKELTNRECEVLRLISSGLTTSQIAEKLFLSAKTVETHRARIMQKLDIHKASGLVSYAIRSGLV